MLARLSAFVIWALVAATAVFWGLRLFVRAPVAPAYAVPVGDSSAVRGDLSRLLGSAPVVTAAAAPVSDANARFRLLGIMAPKTTSGGGYGVALIAVDGKMPKAFSVGASVDNGLVLQSVSLRTVSIGPGQGAAPSITLELPPLAAAATGKLPPGGLSGPYVPSGTPAGGVFTPPPVAPQVAVPVSPPPTTNPTITVPTGGQPPQGVPVPPQ